MGEKLGGMELKLAEAKSLSLAQVNETAELKVALEVAEDKRYNTGFVDAENSVQPIIFQSRHHGFSEGWAAALQAMGVLDDFPLRNLEQIPYPEPPPPGQNPTNAEEEREIASMRELVEAIDSYVELVDLEITSNPDALPRSTPASILNPAV